MYLIEAKERINSINWDFKGSMSPEVEADMACEFLRRLACFFKEEGIRPIKPLVANIAKLLGDKDEIDISEYCSLEVLGFLGENTYVKNIVQYYLHLAMYADKNPDKYEYLKIYDPLIRILERGGVFVLKINSLDIVNGAHIPLNGWYDNFITMEPIETDGFE